MDDVQDSIDKALEDGMKAALSGDLTNPTYATLEERMAFRAGWMEQMKRMGDTNAPA